MANKNLKIDHSPPNLSRFAVSVIGRHQKGSESTETVLDPSISNLGAYVERWKGKRLRWGKKIPVVPGLVLTTVVAFLLLAASVNRRASSVCICRIWLKGIVSTVGLSLFKTFVPLVLE